jgi:hypothetical protein
MVEPEVQYRTAQVVDKLYCSNTGGGQLYCTYFPSY